MEFDIEELVSQAREEMLKQKRFLHIDIVVPDIADAYMKFKKGEQIDVSPISSVEGKADAFMEWLAIQTMKTIEDKFRRDNPMLEEFMNYTADTGIDISKEIINIKRRKETNKND